MPPVDVKSIVLHDNADAPALLTLLAARLLKVQSLKVQAKKSGDSHAQVLPQNVTLKGDVAVARFIASNFSATANGANALEAAEIEQWISSGLALVAGDGSPKEVSTVVRDLNNHLALRTFFVGHQLTLADMAVWVGLTSALSKNKGNVRVLSQSPFVHRWFKFIGQHPGASDFQSETGLGAEKKAAAPKKEKKNASGKREISAGHAAAFKPLQNLDEVDMVVTRFPPEPSGFLHIGHAKAAMLNAHYAKANNGKLRVRFDDTNPSKEKDEFRAAILSDLATLGIKPDLEITHTSDYFDTIQAAAIQLLNQDDAYIDLTEHEQMKQERMDGVVSKYRDNSLEENLRLFDEMLKGSPEGQKCVMRAKIKPRELGEDVDTMKSANKCLRDPGMYRVVVDTPHNRTGLKYKAYPLYDLACPIVDSIEGVTHALRSNEYHDRNPLYYWVLDKLKLRRVFIEDFARLNFTYTLLSKRKLQWFVDQGLVSGWDSPAFPTIQGITRRGLTVEALLLNVGAQGASKSEVLMDMDKVWAINRKMLDPVVPRHVAVAKDGAVELTLSNVSEAFQRTVPKHKKNADLGNKVTRYSSKVVLEAEDANSVKEGEKVTLMDWGNCVIDKVNRNADGVVTSLEGTMKEEDKNFSGTKKLTWLSLDEDIITVKMVEFQHLITKKRLEEGDNFADFVAKPLSTETIAYADANVALLSKGDKLQLERKGFFICDKISHREGDVIELVMIPDGKSKAKQ